MPAASILVGRVAGAFGVRGEIRITTFTEDPVALTRYRALKREDGTPGLLFVSARALKGAVIVRAEGIETRDQAQALRGLKLFIDRADLPPPDQDEYYLADLIGLSVESPAGDMMGQVRSVQDFGAGDLIEIRPLVGTSYWLPFTREVVPVVDIAAGKLVVVRPAETE